MTKLATTRRAMLGAMAVAPVAAAVPGALQAAPSTNEFDRLVRRYWEMAAASDREYASGSIRKANVAYEAKLITFDELKAAEDANYDTFTKPRWDLAQRIYATPAPTIAALAAKMKIAIAEDDGDPMEGGVVKAFAADIERLAAGRGA